MKENNIQIDTLVVQGAREALLGMSVGETKFAPANITYATLRSECSKLNSKGYAFSIKTVDGIRAVTRLK